MTENFFEEFAASTKKIWEAQATRDLKGKDFEQTLVWHTPEGFDVQPYYAEEDLIDLPIEAIQQAQKSKKSSGWQNRPRIRFFDEKTTNKAISDTLLNGAQAVEIDFQNIDINTVNLARLLDKVRLSDTPVYFRTSQPEALLTALGKCIHYPPKGGLIFDSLGDFLTGVAILTDKTWESTKNTLLSCTAYTGFRALTIRSETFHNAGADTVQELAFTLASATTYIDKLTGLGLDARQIVSHLEFSLAIGTNYFMEIAKIRSLRFLWSKILEAYGITEPTCRIHTHTSFFYDAAIDPHTNMLRATTEAMSAVMGGCDSLSVHGYDAVFNPNTNEMSERIARNISILLSDESYLGKSHDLSAGSYYIESLTHQLSEAAWNLFLTIEQKGGILQAFEEGFVQTEIEKAYQLKVSALQQGKVMVGVNKFMAPGGSTHAAPTPATTDPHFLPNRRLSAIFE